MSRFLRHMEAVLDVASKAGPGAGNSAIVFDRQGGLRMLDPAGWSLDGMINQFGAWEVYRVEMQGARVRVEGWSPSERCLIERQPAWRGAGNPLFGPACPAPHLIQASAQSTKELA